MCNWPKEAFSRGHAKWLHSHPGLDAAQILDIISQNLSSKIPSDLFRNDADLTDMVIERGHYVIGHKGPLEASNSWRIPPTSSYQKSAIVKNQICLAEAEVDEKS